MQLSRNASIALAIVGLSYWLIFGGTFAGSLSWLHPTIGHIFLVVVIAGAGWHLWRKNLQVEIHRPPAALCVLLGLILADKFVRVLLRQSWNSAEDFATSVAGVVIFILLLNILQQNIFPLNPARDVNELTTVCVPAVVACALAGMVLMFVKHDQELVYPLGSKILMAGLLTLAIPLAMGRLRALFRSHPGGKPDRPAHKFFWLFSALILAAGLILTRSAVAIVLLPFAVASPLALGNKKRGRMVAVLGLSLVILGGALYSTRFRGGTDATQSWDNRVRYWSGALPAIAERPLAGWGSGQVGLTYPPFRIQRAGYAPSGELVSDLHNVPLQWVYEFGLVGLTLRLVAFGVLLLRGYSRRTPQQKTAVIALGMYGVFCLLHYNLNNPATISMATLIAVMTVNAPAPWRPTIPASKRTGLVLLSVALALLSFEARLDYANYLLARSNHEAGNEGVESVLRAGLLDSRGGFYDAAAAFRIDQIIRDSGHDTSPGTNPGTSNDQAFLLRAAENHYRQALDANPQSPQLTAAYGDFLMRAKRPCDAIEILERAVSLDFYFSLSHFNLANAYAVCRSGSQAANQAADEAGIAILTMPTLAYCTQWRNDPAFLERALDKSWEWVGGWKAARWPADVEKFRRLDAFVQAVRARPTAGQRRVQIFLSEQIAPGLTSDPFAYIFQRRSPSFGLTRIEIDGLDTGTWTPEGMGQIKSLRPLRDSEIAAAYRDRGLDALMRSLDSPARE